MEPVIRHSDSLDWITLSLLIGLVLFSFARYYFPKRFEEFIFLPLSNKYFLVQGRNDELPHTFNIILFSNQVIVVSLFLMVLLERFSPGLMDGGWISFIQVAAIYGSFILAKVCIEKIVGLSFKIEPLVTQYLYFKLSYRNLIGMLLWIINLVIYYIWSPPDAVLVGFVSFILIINCITLIYCYKTNEKTILRNFFYFILYLCALEISPYVILFKVFVA